jgi:hypothetical protein
MSLEVGMGDRLPEDLVERIGARLKDEWRRTGEGDWQRTPPALRRKHENPTLVGSMLQSIFDSTLANAAPAEPLKPIEPLSEAAVAKVEKSLGFPLPGDLRQLYREIGDGNFGPFFGIRRLSNWAKDYLKLRAELAEERGHPWPENLLPLVFLNGKRVCLDRDTGRVVLWARPPKRCSAKKWDASFVPQAESLAEWLERWVDTPTWCEGGPEGGWQPPEQELERRAAVVREKQERQAAAEEKARQVEFSAHPPLDEELIQRIVERAADPDRRTHTSGTMAKSRPVDLDAMARDLEANPYVDDAVKNQLGGMARRAGLFSNLLGLTGLRVAGGSGQGFVMGFEGAGGKLGRPASGPAIEQAEKALGFAVPVPLRQLYELADGGFGPGDDGLWPLARVAKTYSRLTGKPQGPNDEPWPARLLPIAEADPALYCFDLSDGSVVVHDVQEMDHLGHGQWQRSFSKMEPSLSAWLERWLGAPTFAEQAEVTMREAIAAHHARPPSPVTGFPMQLDDPAQQAEAEIVFLEHSEPLRKDFGLPEAGWQDEIRRRHGLI